MSVELTQRPERNGNILQITHSEAFSSMKKYFNLISRWPIIKSGPHLRNYQTISRSIFLSSRGCVLTQLRYCRVESFIRPCHRYPLLTHSYFLSFIIFMIQRYHLELFSIITTDNQIYVGIIAGTTNFAAQLHFREIFGVEDNHLPLVCWSSFMLVGLNNNKSGSLA